MRDNEVPFEIINFDLESIIEEVDTFYISFLELLEDTVSTIRPGPDKYGNQFQDPYLYNYAEITYNYPTRFESIRLLGVGENLQKIRFHLAEIPNPFTITTLNLVQNIKDIVKPVNNFEDFFSCDPQRKNKWANDFEVITKGISEIGEPSKQKYNWEQLSAKFFSPKPIYRTDEITDQQIEALQRDMKNNGPFSPEDLDNFLISSNENKQKIADKADNKKEKSKTLGEKQKELQEALKDNWTRWTDKYSVSCLIKEAMDCVVPKNLTCRQLFENLPPGQLFSRIKAVFPQGSRTLNEIETIIVNALVGVRATEIKKEIADLRKWIKEDENLKSKDSTTEEQKNNLQEKIEEKRQQIRSLEQELATQLEEKQVQLGLTTEQANAFLQRGDIGTILFAIENGEGDPLVITNAILSAIDLIIPIESICEAITSALAGNGIPQFELPSLKQPATDPLGGVSFELNQAFQLAIQQAIISLLDGIFSELVNCDNLDRFIAEIVSNPEAEGSGKSDQLKTLFGGGEDLFGEGGILDRNYDRVIDQLSSKAENIANVSAGGQKIGIGLTREQFTGITNPNSSTTALDAIKNASQTITDTFERSALSASANTSLFQQKVKDAESRWNIDSTGTRFEIEAGTQVINLQEIDKFFSSLEREKLEQIQSSNDVSLRALNDAAGLEAIVTQKQALESSNSSTASGISVTQSNRTSIKQEMNSVFRTLISTMSPSQFLSLLAGSATEQTKKLGYELFKISDIDLLEILVNNQNAFERLLYSFGRLSGLDNLEDEVQLLIESPEFQMDLDPTRCGNFTNVAEFRQSLMGNLVEPEKARQIVEELEKQRVDRFQQMLEQMSNLMEGRQLEQSIDRNSALLSAVKAAREGNDIAAAVSNNQRKTGQERPTISDSISSMKSNIENANPVLQSMFNIVIDSLFVPIESMFLTDMKSLGEGYSEIEEVEEPIDRTIEIRGGPFNAFSQRVINPKFKQLVDTGLIPVIEYAEDGIVANDGYAKMIDKSLLVTETFPPQPLISASNTLGAPLPVVLSYLTDDPTGEKGLANRDSFDERPIFRYKISGDAEKSFIEKGFNGVNIPPVSNKVNKRVVGSSIKRNVAKLDYSDEITEETLKFTIAGSLEKIGDNLLNESGLQQEVQLALQEAKPSWNIEFNEQSRSNQIRNTIKLQTTGKTVSNINGPEDFFVPQLEYSSQTEISDQVYQSMTDKYGPDTNKKRKEVFDDIIIEQLKDFFVASGNTQEVKNMIKNIFVKDFSTNSIGFYANFIDNFIKGLSRDLASPRLMQAAQTLSNGEVLTELEVLDFIKCAVDGDITTILNFKLFRDEMKQIYDSIEEPPVNQKQLRGEEKRETKISRSAKMIISNMYVKTICLDFIIKALPMLDHFRFSNSLVNNQMLMNVVCEYVIFELRRNSTDYVDLVEFVQTNLAEYYKIKEYRKIESQERREHDRVGYNFSIELKEIARIHIRQLLAECKEITKSDVEKDIEGIDDFIYTIINSYKVLETNSSSGFDDGEEGKAIFSPLRTNDGITLQRFIYVPKYNLSSQIVRDNISVFGKYKDTVFDNILSIEEAEKAFSEIYYELGINFDLYVCEGDEGYNERLLESPYEVGLRLVSYEKKQDGSGQSLLLNGRNYPYNRRVCEKKKLGYIREGDNEYDVYQLAEERLRVNAKQSIGVFVGSNNKLRYDNEFFERLKINLSTDQEVELLLGFALPLKEVTSMLLLHFLLSNNDEKMKYLFEPTKKKITEMSEYLDLVGDNALSSKRIKETMEKQRKETENVGNPAGPINAEALKMFYRTPIQILKSLTVMTDPNVALTDKVIRTVSAVTSLLPPEVKPPFIPYSVVSLSLLPAPIFTPPPVGIIPPLTAYNPASPLNYIFFGLEPLLWDLPYFQNYNKESNGNGQVCEDSSQTDEEQE